MASVAMRTPVGPLTVLVRDGAVLAAGFTADPADLMPLVSPDLRSGLAEPAGSDPPGDLELIAKAVDAYFAGDPDALDQVEVRQHSGGAFLTHAWQVLRRVPAGEPVTYRQFAAAAGRPAAVRAAAQVCARNAVALFVPCHRVVRTDGSLGGYRWGIKIKEFLLDHEGHMSKKRS